MHISQPLVKQSGKREKASAALTRHSILAGTNCGVASRTKRKDLFIGGDDGKAFYTF